MPRPAEGLELEGTAAWTLGVRPQDLSVVDAGDADLHLRVDVLEPLGAETFVYGSLEGGPSTVAGERDASTSERLSSPSIVRLPPEQQVGIGDLLSLRVSGGQAHIFDAAGRRITAFDS